MAYHYLWLEASNGALDRELAAERAGAVAGGADHPGNQIRDFGAALLATIVIAVVDITIGPCCDSSRFRSRFLTLGLFLLVLNAFLLKLASMFTPGFRIDGFLNALWARWC
jgi:uncharacterized membrane protein YvlD (DUF360 family)